MSITDGQWILDMDIFRSGIRPALSIGLSVTRAGGVGHNKRQKVQADKALKVLADYHQAEEFSHFGSELAVGAKQSLATGKRIFEILTQGPGDTFSFMAQQLMLDIVLNMPATEDLNIAQLKLKANEYGAMVKADEDFDKIRDQLKAICLVELKGAESSKPAAPAAPAAPADEKTPPVAKEEPADKVKAGADKPPEKTEEKHEHRRHLLGSRK
jgi:F-type H+-transporting ATPase subunit alpha